MTPVALTFSVLQTSGSLGELSVLFAARSMPAIVFTVFGGWSADILNRRLTIVFADLSRATVFLLLGVALITHIDNVFYLSGLMFTLGVVRSIEMPATNSLVTDIVTTAELKEANAVLSGMDSIACVVGPLITALLSQFMVLGYVVIFNAMACVINSVLVYSLKLNTEADLKTGRPSRVEDILNGWREFKSRKWLVIMTVQLSFLQAFVSIPYVLLGPQMLMQHVNGIALWSMMVSTEGIGAIVGSWLGGYLKINNILIMTKLFVFGTALPMLALSLNMPSFMLLLASFLFGISTSVYGIFFNVGVQRSVPSRTLSRVTAFEMVVTVLLNPLGYLILSPLVKVLGIASVLLYGGMFTVISTVIVLFLIYPHSREIVIPEPDKESI